MIAFLKIANRRPCHSPSPGGEGWGEGELCTDLVGRAYPRAVIPTGRLNFCPLRPFLSLHLDRITKSIQRYSKPIKGFQEKKLCPSYLTPQFLPRRKVHQINSCQPWSTPVKPSQDLPSPRGLFFSWPRRKPGWHTSHPSYLSHSLLQFKICVSSVQICGSNQGNQSKIKPSQTGKSALYKTNVRLISQIYHLNFPGLCP
jgi:hypothetical protein